MYKLAIFTRDMDTLFDKIKRVKGFVFDVDGVLASSIILVTEEGHQLRSFSTRDGYAVQLAIRAGYSVAIISGGDTQGVVKRLSYLGVTDIYMGVTDKKKKMEQWAAASGLVLGELMYMGDDIPDLTSMRGVGLPVCPADAVAEIKHVSYYVSPFQGGQGAVRDVIEKVLKLNGHWIADTAVKSQ